MLIWDWFSIEELNSRRPHHNPHLMCRKSLFHKHCINQVAWVERFSGNWSKKMKTIINLLNSLAASNRLLVVITLFWCHDTLIIGFQIPRWYLCHLAVVGIKKSYVKPYHDLFINWRSNQKKLIYIKIICARKHMLEQKLIKPVNKVYYSKHSLLDRNIIWYITF